MLITHVHVHVKHENIEDFIKASEENAMNSRREPGIVRFDLLQNREDPDRFVLTEIYRTDADPARHKETEHYKKWRTVVEPMIVEPRRSEKFSNLSPRDEDWA